MQGRSRRIVLIAAGAVAVWYLVVLFSWALRPQHDAIPVGRDYDAKDQRLISQDVTCNSLFASSSFDGNLPVLKKLVTKDAPPLEYQREACTLVQRDARIVFGLDTLGVIAAVGGLLFVALRKGGAPAGSHADPAPSYA